MELSCLSPSPASSSRSWSSHVTIHIEHRCEQTRSPQRCKKVSPRLDGHLGQKCFRANRPLVCFFWGGWGGRVALRNWLCAAWLCTSMLGAMCFARTAPREFSRKWSSQAALFQAAAQQVALCKLLHASALCKLLCASALRQLLRASALRMCSVQVGLCKLLRASALCKLLCASCSAQVTLRKLLCASAAGAVGMYFAYYFCTEKLRFSSRSCGSVLRVLRLYLKVAIFQPEPHTTSVLKSCDFPAGAAGARATFVFKSCDFQAGAAADRSRGHIKKTQKTSSFCTSTTPISAEGRAGISENAKNLEFLHLDHADPRRGSRGHIKNAKNLEFLHLDHADLRRVAREYQKSQKTQVFAPRPRRSPQRVAREYQKNTKTLSFCTSTTPIPAEGRIPDRRQHPHPPP